MKKSTLKGEIALHEESPSCRNDLQALRLIIYIYLYKRYIVLGAFLQFIFVSSYFTLKLSFSVAVER